MTGLPTRIASIADRWPKGLALLLGLISATGFAPLNLWPLTLLALTGWMLLVARSPRGARAFGIGWGFGVGHFALGLNWIATAFTYQAAMPAWLGWIAVALLSLYLAIYPALAAWGAWTIQWFAAPAKPALSAGKAAEGAGTTLSFIFAFAASVSLGATRRFKLRHRRYRSAAGTLDLAHGDLLLMAGPTQHHYLHAVPKTARPVGVRVNLTFRWVRPDR